MTWSHTVRWVVLFAGLLLPVDGACGQQSLASALVERERVDHAPVRADERGWPLEPPASAEAALQAMFAEAGVVFAGEVIRVQRGDGFVDIRFRVDEAVRGVTAGTLYTLREWNGLWTDQARYVSGERLLLLLHAVSAAGYSSPVGGMDGAIPISGDAVAGTVDLRWVAARDVRRSGRATVVSAVGAGERGGPGADASAAAGDALAHTDRGVVMDLLHAWQRSAAAR